MSEHELLQKRLAAAQSNSSSTVRGASLEPPQPLEQRQNLDICQWQVEANGMFRPAAKTIETLPAGAYATGMDQFGAYFVAHKLLCDEIINLPDSVNERILAGIQKFWSSKERYRDHKLLFKRGALLWGPPGSGKTVTIHMLARDLIQRGGLVLFCSNPKVMLELLKSTRVIEPDRPLIVVMEDIDEIIDAFGEHVILSMLDGENQTDNVVYVATTNYPEKLGARIINRPSRFDEVIMVGMPSDLARGTYIGATTKMEGEELANWVAKTKGLSVAHLRELVAAVFCLDQKFENALARLKAMNETRLKDPDGFEPKKLGLI